MHRITYFINSVAIYIQSSEKLLGYKFIFLSISLLFWIKIFQITRIIFCMPIRYER